MTTAARECVDLPFVHSLLLERAIPILFARCQRYLDTGIRIDKLAALVEEGRDVVGLGVGLREHIVVALRNPGLGGAPDCYGNVAELLEERGVPGFLTVLVVAAGRCTCSLVSIDASLGIA